MKKKIVLSCILVGLLIGLFATVAYHKTMTFTSTDDFCLSCHNHQIPYSEYQQTVHYTNAHGVTAGCADCHVPHEFLPKIFRKMQAAREVYGHFRGVIDTDAKYLAHREEMKAIEIARLKANDSQECRNCHRVERMDLAAQSSVAQKKHQQFQEGKTCIDCHQGIVHTSAVEDDDFDF